MSFLIAGSVIGGIILYNNSDDLMIETLRMYTNIQEYFQKKKGFLQEKQQDSFDINDTKINKYVCNNKEFYTLNSQTKPSQDLLTEYSLQLNPILSITLKINNNNYEVPIISQFLFIDRKIELNENTNEIWIQIVKHFQNLEIIYDKKDAISWEILNTDFETINGKNIKLYFDSNKFIMSKN